MWQFPILQSLSVANHPAPAWLVRPNQLGRSVTARVVAALARGLMPDDQFSHAKRTLRTQPGRVICEIGEDASPARGLRPAFVAGPKRARTASEAAWVGGLQPERTLGRVHRQGKAHKPNEFGVKVSVATPLRRYIIAHAATRATPRVRPAGFCGGYAPHKPLIRYAVVNAAKINAQKPGSFVAEPNQEKYKGSKPHGCVRGGLSTNLSTKRWISFSVITDCFRMNENRRRLPPRVEAQPRRRRMVGPPARSPG